MFYYERFAILSECNESFKENNSALQVLIDLLGHF